MLHWFPFLFPCSVLCSKKYPFGRYEVWTVSYEIPLVHSLSLSVEFLVQMIASYQKPGGGRCGSPRVAAAIPAPSAARQPRRWETNAPCMAGACCRHSTHLRARHDKKMILWKTSQWQTFRSFTQKKRGTFVGFGFDGVLRVQRQGNIGF